MSFELNLEKIFRGRITNHIIFWVGYILFFGTLYGAYNENYEQSFGSELVFLPVKMLATYFTLYYLLPKFILQGKYVQFGLWVILLVVVSCLLQRFVTYYVYYPIWAPSGQNYPLLLPHKILKEFVGIYPVIGLAAAIKLLRIWYRGKEDRQVLVQEKLASELKFLKTQIHPHFLFNTLNNLYALTLKKSDQAPEMVLKLSDLMNYMLYECNTDKVPLSKEVKFLHDYLEIEQMRYGDLLELNLSIQGNHEGKSIAPLIFLPFLENAFKHGANSQLDKAWVTINLEIKERELSFKVENNREAEVETGNGKDKGIGLKNVKRRLDLLYPDQYELKVLEETGSFLITLKIPI
ncbi:MAG: histidine kinase [Cyclobacteriaceae bacterium]